MTESYPVAFGDRPNTVHWTPDTVTWDDIIAWVKKPAKRKECGGYILAELAERQKVHHSGEEPCDGGYHRDNMSVVRRSAILALDIDTPEDGFDVTVELALAGVAYILHTTYSSTPSEPRYRLLVQADRDMAPAEYIEATKALAVRLGEGNFDSGTFQTARFMYKPAARKPEWYDYVVNDGEPIGVDELLLEYDLNSAETPKPKPSRNKRDPFELPDPVGAFNRAYEDLDVLIEQFELPYEKLADDRYRLIGAASEAGMGPMSEAPGLFYSHHAGDPAYGKTCSAFDLVRLHWFGHEDEAAKPNTPVNKLPSHEAMLEVASKDSRVINEIFNGMTSDFDPVTDDDEDVDPEDRSWRTQLQLSRQGKFLDIISNWDTVMKHDHVFSLLYWNMLTMSVEASGDLPWRPVRPNTRTFDKTDQTNLRFYLEREYRIRPAMDLVDQLVITRATKNRVSPVHDYLESLVWDGTPRVESCLPGAADTPYNRLVARKVLTAAVARVYQPGCKWDHTLVLQGGEGLGKSTWIERMAFVGVPERRAYNYTLGRISDKDTYLAMHASWIVVADEGHSLRKADNDAMKEFLTRTHDHVRAPYDRDTVLRLRQFVIWSTTNDETFLRRQEGNRRFLMVKCQERIDIDALTSDYIDQLWAEAVHLYKSGERLYLLDEEAELAEAERDPFLEEDSDAGLIEEYLATLVPMDWWSKTKEQRVQWLTDRSQGFEPEGDVLMDRTCTQAIWYEVLGQRNRARRTDLIELANSLKSLGWVSAGSQHFPGYGTQTVFVRPDDGEDLL